MTGHCRRLEVSRIPMWNVKIYITAARRSPRHLHPSQRSRIVTGVTLFTKQIKEAWKLRVGQVQERVTGRTSFEIANLIDEPAEAAGYCAMVGDYGAACKVDLGQDGRGDIATSHSVFLPHTKCCASPSSRSTSSPKRPCVSGKVSYLRK